MLNLFQFWSPTFVTNKNIQIDKYREGTSSIEFNSSNVHLSFLNYSVSACWSHYKNQRGWQQWINMGWLLVNAITLLYHFCNWSCHNRFISTIYSRKSYINKYARVHHGRYYQVKITLRSKFNKTGNILKFSVVTEKSELIF